MKVMIIIGKESVLGKKLLEDDDDWLVIFLLKKKILKFSDFIRGVEGVLYVILFMGEIKS